MSHDPCSRQQGAVLIISLVMLTVMTLLGVTAMQSTVLQEKMAGNFRDKHLAFEAAGIAMNDGEQWLMNLASDPVAASDGTNRIWTLDALGPEWWNEPTSWANADVFAGPVLVSQPPRCLLEESGFVSDGALNIGTSQDHSGRVLYRVTARGTGGSNNAVAIVQSIYAKRY